MSKTLLVLGASTYQLPAIVTAKQLGYRVITIDNVPANPGHTLADACFEVDTTDQDAVLALVGRERISGVIAPATDVAVMTASYLSEQLGIPGSSLSAARVLTNKQIFRKFLAGAGLPCPYMIAIGNDDLPSGELFDGRKWLVKPNRSSGSKGVYIVRSESEFFAYINESKSFSVDGTAVLEEFIDGSQHTCEGVLRDGKVVLSLITDRDTAAYPYTTTTGHRVPSMLSETAQAKALHLIEVVFGQLGVTSGPFDCDFVANGERIVLIEMTSRLGGNSLSKLFQVALDFDLVAYAVTNACGDDYPIPVESRSPRPSAVVILGVDSAGKLAWNEQEEDALRREPWVDTLILDLPQGAQVMPFINGRRRVGEALITGATRDEVDARIVELKSRLALAAV
jgi:biotin carboxylase